MKHLIAVFILYILFSVPGFGQSKPYWSVGGEMLFSWADITDNGGDANSTLRWAPVINLQGKFNKDFSAKFGVFTGLYCRNVGYIYDDYQDRTLDPNVFGNPHKEKFRSYNIGAPIGIKIGDLERTHFYGGYEIEFPIHYKEKTFDGGDKTNTTKGWFSDRQEPFQHGFFVGVQFPYDFAVTFKYYVSEFHNQDYTRGDGIKPYAGLDSHIMYISVGYNIAVKE
ncbi:MAG: hypothetical protein IT270_19880 [Saprospiraceae bacterium]|nr:hypothetical protein [Saprospiraceae bacterium]